MPASIGAVFGAESRTPCAAIEEVAARSRSVESDTGRMWSRPARSRSNMRSGRADGIRGLARRGRPPRSVVGLALQASDRQPLLRADGGSVPRYGSGTCTPTLQLIPDRSSARGKVDGKPLGGS